MPLTLPEGGRLEPERVFCYMRGWASELANNFSNHVSGRAWDAIKRLVQVEIVENPDIRGTAHYFKKYGGSRDTVPADGPQPLQVVELLRFDLLIGLTASMGVGETAEFFHYGSSEYAAPILADLLRRLVDDLAATRSDAWEPDRIQLCLNITVELDELDDETQVDLEVAPGGLERGWRQIDVGTGRLRDK